MRDMASNATAEGPTDRYKLVPMSEKALNNQTVSQNGRYQGSVSP